MDKTMENRLCEKLDGGVIRVKGRPLSCQQIVDSLFDRYPSMDRNSFEEETMHDWRVNLMENSELSTPEQCQILQKNLTEGGGRRYDSFYYEPAAFDYYFEGAGEDTYGQPLVFSNYVGSGFGIGVEF